MGSVVVPLTVLAGGAALVWAGIANPAGGAFVGLGNLLRGVPNTRAGADPTGFVTTAADLSAVTGAGASTAAGDGSTGPLPAGAVSGRRAKVLTAASTWLGVPYLFGGNTRHGVDCSGFTSAVYSTVGVYLPRVSYLQAKVGRRVSEAQAQPGDLVAFGSPVHHVGIYVGGGNIVNAPHTGTVVRVEPVWHTEPVQYRNVLGTAKAKRRKPRHSVTV